MRKPAIAWACRRGMLELDLMLNRFFEHVYDTLNATQQQDFVRLLACSDLELFRWLFKNEAPQDAALVDIIKRIQQHQHSHASVAH